MTDSTVNPSSNDDTIGVTADIVMAYVSNNAISPTDLPRLIADVHDAILALGQSSGMIDEAVEPAKPAVSIRKSVTRDHIVCLEDGKKFKSLKRHLQTHHNMTPEEYRAKWGLPSDYPMVAPSYSEQRSKLAVKAGLGRRSA